MIRTLLVFLSLITLLNFGCKNNSDSIDITLPETGKEGTSFKPAITDVPEASGVVGAVEPAVAVVPVAPAPVGPPPGPPAIMGFPSLDEHFNHRRHRDEGEPEHEKKKCEESNAPQCGGHCPRGEQCFDNDGMCDCRPAVSCGESSAPTCGGTCKNNMKCNLIAGACTCQLPCSSTDGPQCGGFCEGDLSCVPFNGDGPCACRAPEVGNQ